MMNYRKRLWSLLFFVAVVIVFGGCSQEVGNSASGNNGMVVSVHPTASEIGLNVLKEGGNAVDAAVATGLALGVVDQYHSGIGGGGFLVIRLANGTVYTIDGREKAPAAATREMYIEDGKFNPDLSQKGPLAVAVPGLLAAYDKALELGGSKPLSELISPSIDLASHGFELDDYYISDYLETIVELRKDPASREIYFHSDGSPLRSGDTLKQRDLAKTYRGIAQGGIDYFYHGDFAQDLTNYMVKSGGLITVEDMANYTAVVRDPVIGQYRDYEIIGMGPPSSGGIHLVQILNMIEASGILKGKSSWDEESIFYTSRFMAKAFEDRSEFLGDSDFYPVPISRLTSKAYAESSLSVVMEGEQGIGQFYVGMEPGHTANFCVIDQWGNAVAVNQTVNLYYGAKVTVPGTGVILNSEMDDFSAFPGVPNHYGLIGSEANAIEPGKRPLSSMSPTVIVNEGKPVMILGGAGGGRIITAVLQVFVNFFDLNMDLPEALGFPRFHHQFKPETLFMEKTAPESMRVEQEQRGQNVVLKEALGKVQAITWGGKERVYVGASDPRFRGGAAAY